ncbi:expressed unknown protein [Seminavis robusta]|uniref:PsbP C-terminal domain-containing protein n=1 Tax=Seminavis robusta TaxID=568900 RepID=A0A9N8DDS7_9STRA|nr:expressed unknown protein [Seminavis robusta]|eukprot:Sro72_g039930.1 n/a (136) ;mRNA; r:81417-81824
MSDPMRKVMKLFLVLAEEDKTMEEVRPLADALFHDECRMQVDGQVMLNKPRVMKDMDSLVQNNVTMELIKVEKDEVGLAYEYMVKKPREKAHKMLASAMVRDGKLYHVEIKDAAQPADVNKDHARRVSAPAIRGF